MPRIGWLIWTKHLDTIESQNLKREPKKLKTESQNLTPKHIMVFPSKIILMLCERSLNPGGKVLYEFLGRNVPLGPWNL